MDQSSRNSLDRPSSGPKAASQPQNQPCAGVTRLAPSPTGALHIGNARTFLINWILARHNDWRIVMRIEDLDGPRNKPGADTHAIDTLKWLGIDWDEGPYYQLHDLNPYVQAMSALAERALAFPSTLSRKEIIAATSAPQQAGEPSEVFCPASLRPEPLPPGAFDPDLPEAWRFCTPDSTVEFNDLFAGPQRLRPCDSVGDFPVWAARGEPAYQLAVVVDDHRQGVTHIVRGDDLLDSAARQTLIYRALGLTPIPNYCHLPLVIGADGRRLAKRHGDTRVSYYREAGASPERVIGLIAWLSGQVSARTEVALDELLARFDLQRVPRTPVVFGPEDDAWLLA